MSERPATLDHVFLGDSHGDNERRTRLTIGLTFAMMVGEIVCGTLFNSMALLADGWHMATHAGALTVAVLAYRYAKAHARDRRFSFGTGKIGDLSGFTSAVALAFISLMIAWQSVARLLHPLPIGFNEAILVAVLGLGVNIASAWLLGGGHLHAHPHHHSHEHAHEGHDHDHEDAESEAHKHAHADHNLRGAYLHVVADALTSVMAIVALLAGRELGWTWMDPAMGLVGSLVIVRWSLLLMRDTARVLLDVEPDTQLCAAIRGRLEEATGGDVTDLHVWRVAPGKLAAIVVLETAHPEPAAYYRDLLEEWSELVHINVEVIDQSTASPSRLRY